MITQVFNACVKHKQVPKEWNVGYMSSLHVNIYIKIRYEKLLKLYRNQCYVYRESIICEDICSRKIILIFIVIIMIIVIRKEEEDEEEESQK